MINAMKRKIKCIEHIICHSDFFNNIFKARLVGRRPRGRSRINYFYDVEEKMGSHILPTNKENSRG